MFLSGKIRKRHVHQNKVIAIQEICGKYMETPVYPEDIEEEEESPLCEETEDKKFPIFVKKCILMLTVCDAFFDCLKDLKRKKQSLEKLTFQFSDNEENRLYRKFQNLWLDTWDMTILARRKENQMTFYQESLAKDRAPKDASFEEALVDLKEKVLKKQKEGKGMARTII